MTTKAALLKAAKAIIAADKKAPTRKKNPATRKGTAKPRRASQITGAAPTKRLVKRRKANKVEGYFPNPAEVAKAHRGHAKGLLLQCKEGSAWKTICELPRSTDKTQLSKLAHYLAMCAKHPVRVVVD